MQPPKVLLTDIGNVLLRIEFGTTERFYCDIFRIRDEARVHDIIHESEDYFALERGTLGWEEFRERCINALIEAGSASDLRSAKNREWLLANFDRYWLSPFRTPVAEVIALWRSIRRHMVVASASNVDAMRFAGVVGRHRQIMDVIDHETHSFRIGARKGDDDYFRRLLKMVGAAPEECVFVDDLAAHTEIAARSGIRAVRLADTTVAGVASLRNDLVAAGVPAEWLTAAPDPL